MPSTSSVPPLDNPLLIGSSGQLGTAIGADLKQAIPLRRDDLDLARASIDSVRKIISTVQPSSIINCTGYTAVDHAEDEEDLATAVNGTAVGILSNVAAEAGIPFLTFSTDYVFDGRASKPYVESDVPNPIGAYGRSKLAGERLALASNPQALVIRTSWLISGTHSNFVATILRMASEGKSARVVNDQYGCPTVARDLARASLSVARSGVSGLLHLTNQGPTTWFDLAQTAIRFAGLDPSPITPCTTEEYPTRASRPAYSVLGSERAPQLGIVMPHWQESLADLVSELTSK